MPGAPPIRTVKESGDGFDTRDVLAHAARQAEERSFRDFTIVDVDAHHYETESWAEIAEHIEDPVIRRLAQMGGVSKLTGQSNAAYNWQERSMEQLNKFLSVHALGFPFYNMIHLTNWVINGILERFPNLRVVWIESGLAWIPFLMQRLDDEYMMRSSEAPSLTKRPSEYMREFYYTSQPMEFTGNTNALRVTFEMMDAENQLMYSSDYPHWDFDLPSKIDDLPFLSEETKRKILGGNALELFGIDDEMSAKGTNS